MGCLKGNIPWNKGKVGVQEYTKERNKKISIALAGRPNPKLIGHPLWSTPPKGDKHWNWKGLDNRKLALKRIRQSVPVKKWSSDVLKKDDYTCQICTRRGGKLVAHHLIYFSEIIINFNIKDTKDIKDNSFLLDIDNGTTLCGDCHRAVHVIERQMRKGII